MNPSTCPHCQQAVNVPDNLAGKSVKCPICGEAFVAGGSISSVPPAPPAPPPAWQGEEYAAKPLRRRAYRDAEDEEPPYDQPMEPHRGSTVLVLGILSLVICGPILGPIAWVMGNQDLDKMRRGVMQREGEGITRAGQVCGIIATIYSIVVVVLVLLFVAGGRR